MRRVGRVRKGKKPVGGIEFVLTFLADPVVIFCSTLGCSAFLLGIGIMNFEFIR